MKKSLYIIGVIAILILTLAMASCGSGNIIKYELDGGILPEGAPLELADGNIPDLAEVIPTKEGYAFIGWYVDADLKTKLNADTGKSTDTVYAKWVEAYDITYELNGGTPDDDLPSYYAAGEELDIQEFTASKTGSLFYGWYLDEKLNDHGYIVPGLGDAGDRIFGTK